MRALGLGGVRSALLAPPGNPARYSRHVTECLPWADSRHDPDRLVDVLLAFGAREPEQPVLYYDSDWDLLAVSRHRERLREAFRFVIADATLVERLVDKRAFRDLAREADLPVPDAHDLTDDLDVRAVRYPAIVKPLVRDHETWRPLANAKAVQVTGAEELDAWRRRLARGRVPAIVQEIVPGPERRIASYHVYVDASGDVAGEFTGQKERTYPASFGYSTALSITRDDEVAELGRDVCRRIGLRGVAKLDFKRDLHGRPRLLEINPRFNLWHHPGALAGVNLPLLVYQDLTGLARTARATSTAGVRWVSMPHDWAAARAAGMTPVAWLRWALTAEAKSGFALADPLPLAGAGVGRLGRLLAERVRRDSAEGA